MALALKDRVRETTTIIGTGTATLLGAATGYQAFSTVGNGNTTYYCISDQGGANWEVGIGTYTSAGTTLARTTVLSSSNAGALVVFTAGTKDVFVTYPSEKGVWYDASGNVLFTGATTISVTDNTNAALLITQLGTGNALVVEDSANPDASPFVINASGQLLRGITATVNVASELDGSQVSVGITNASIGNDAALALLNYSNTTTNARPAYMVLGRSNGAPHTQTAVEEADELGILSFQGSDGTNFIRAASIKSVVDGTPGTNDMPGRLVFSTTADGASSPTERMRIDSYGSIGVGGSAGAAYTMYLLKNPTGATSTYGLRNGGTIQSDVTTQHNVFYSRPATAASAFTVGDINHYRATQGTIGAGSTVTAQAGFIVDSNLTGATNNYGFYGAIASGTGRYNLYMAGTADNYMAGSLGIGGAPVAGYKLLNTGTWTGGTTFFGCASQGTIQSDVTASVYTYRSAPNTAAASFTLTNLVHYIAEGSAVIGAGSAITTQQGFSAVSSLTTATNNYGFYGNIAAGTGRYNLYMAGTADNYLAGSLGIGLTAPTSKLHARSDANALTVIGQIQNRTSGANVGVSIAFITSVNDISDNRYAYIGAVTSGAGENGNNLVFAPNSNGGTPTEAMRINSLGNVGVGTSSPNASAILDAQSTTKGVRFPNMTTTQKNAVATPAAGLVVFDTTLAKLCVYSGAAWQTITSI